MNRMSWWTSVSGDHTLETPLAFFPSTRFSYSPNAWPLSWSVSSVASWGWLSLRGPTSTLHIPCLFSIGFCYCYLNTESSSQAWHPNSLHWQSTWRLETILYFYFLCYSSEASCWNLAVVPCPMCCHITDVLAAIGCSFKQANPSFSI